MHPSEDYQLQTMVLEMKEDREAFLVAPGLWSELSNELSPRVIYTTVNRQGVTTLWPVRLPRADGRIDNWSASSLDAAIKAKTQWIRVKANMWLGAYEIFEAKTEVPDPEWRAESFKELLDIAFRGRYIESTEHPVIRRLWGLE